MSWGDNLPSIDSRSRVCRYHFKKVHAVKIDWLIRGGLHAGRANLGLLDGFSSFGKLLRLGHAVRQKWSFGYIWFLPTKVLKSRKIAPDVNPMQMSEYFISVLPNQPRDAPAPLAISDGHRYRVRARDLFAMQSGLAVNLIVLAHIAL